MSTGIFAIESGCREDSPKWTDVYVHDPNLNEPFLMMTIRTQLLKDDNFNEYFKRMIRLMGRVIAEDVHGCTGDAVIVRDINLNNIPQA